MFGSRRRRAASNPPLNGTNANPSATSAATQAFLKNQASNASLSSAAAAAALRSRPTTPTSVADVQTKRTLRRQGSNSSAGSSVAGSSQLQRRGSAGSMSERTFRDPSPSRSSPVPSAIDAPPVPAIPKNIQQAAPSIPPQSHRRAISLEAPAMRVASPPPSMASGRGSSLGPGTIAPASRRPAQRISNLSSVSELTGVERPASRGSVRSVNFSLPTGSRPTSPVGQSVLTYPSPQRAQPPRIVSPSNQNLVYDPNTRSFLPLAEILAIEQRIRDAANREVKKKKRIAPNQATGTHFAAGTVGGRPRGTAIDAMEASSSRASKPAEQPAAQPAPQPIPTTAPVSVPAPVTVPVYVPASETRVEAPKKKKKKRVVVSDSESDQASVIPNSSDGESDVSAKQTSYRSRPGVLLAKKPSIVREDREREEEEDDTPKRPTPGAGLTNLDTSPAAARTISPSPLPRSVAGRGHGRGQASASAAFAQDRQQTRSASQPAPIPNDPSPVTADGVALSVRDSLRGGRVPSVSPSRTTHFAMTPDSLLVKHQPPARSISPRKSALKHPHSPRGQSPIEGQRAGSEVSNGSTVASDDTVHKKKNARVSFDETNVVVGQAATSISSDSPVVQGSQTKRPWFSIGRGKKKETTVADEDDEVMKPRPALPSFGSVRKQKDSGSKEVEERPLVKPAEPTEEKLSLQSPPLFKTPTGEVVEYPMGMSNDHNVGAVISQDSVSRNAANISKSREPLPPEVTSVEGSGYHSESDSSVYSLDNNKNDMGVARANSVTHGPEEADPETYQALFSPVSEHETPTPKPDEKPDYFPTGKVPEITFLQATPTLENADDRREWPDMPGAWWNSSSSENSQNADESSQPIVEHHVTEPTPAEVGIAEPPPEPHQPGSPVLGEIAAQNAHVVPAILEELEESDVSIYSDAAEDLSDTEGDGFMSLDAVVESPVSEALPGLAITTPPDSPTTMATKERAYRKSQLSRKSSEPDIDEGWDKAQEYWAGLSAEKKRRLEIEAQKDAEEGSETEIEVKPKPKPKKKKKVIAQPAPTAVTARPQAIPVNERTYMIQPGAKAGPNGHAPMRSSMRPESLTAPEENHIRKSMRGSDGMRGSLRASTEAVEPRGSLQKKYRPISAPPGEIKANPVEVKKHIRNLSAASAAAASGAAQRDMAPTVPVLRRKGSGDSESSFKRARASSDVSNFRSSMRRSTGQEKGGRQLSPMRSSRYSLRSMSPTGDKLRRPFSSAAPPISLPQTHMRGSMRSHQDSTQSFLGINSSIRMPGFRSSKPKKQKQVRKQISRFADSSDEDEERPAFRSRFVDSSDDDEPQPRSTAMPRSMQTNAPVRGIPKRAGAEDGDSSDLPDSDDEKPSLGLKVGKKRTTNGTVAATSIEGTTLTSGTLRRSGSGRGTIASPTTITSITGPATRPNQSRRGSFMSILRRKKPEVNNKVRKSDAESPARRDTPLERSKSDLAALRVDRPSTPRLQKRHTAWPLPGPTSPPKIGEDARPFSADAGDGVGGEGGVNGSTAADGRPDIGTRHFTATGLANVDLGLNGIGGAGRKKKKFGALRRMLRLDE